jgi:hypothetical protein
MPWVKGFELLSKHGVVMWELFKGWIELSGRFGKNILDIGTKISTWAIPIIESIKNFMSFGGILGNIGAKIISIGSKIMSWAPILKLISFAKFLPGLGWVLTAVQVIYRTFTKWKDLFNDPSMNVGEKILRGLWAVVTSIAEVLIEPFRIAWNWISKLWGGHSPSQLGLSIVRGIQSCEGDMYNALTTPFNEGYDDISKKLSKGINTSLNIEKGASSAYIPIAQFNTNQPSEIASKETTKNVSQKERSTPEASESNKTLSDILLAINNLNKNLESGKIGVYVDGQLMSATIARQTNFRGGFGMNVV